MGKAQDLLPDVNAVEEALSGPMKSTDDEEQEPLSENTVNKTTSSPKLNRYRWWLQMIIYTVFVLTGESVGTLLGRLYFNNGGKSQWMASLVQLVGFPILFPIRWRLNNHDRQITVKGGQFPTILALIYVALGIFDAADCMLYTVGLQYLPVTTYTLVCASQLGFSALFCYILNGQKFTPYIVNSVVLLTISSVLLVFEPDDVNGNANKLTSKDTYAIGFACTIGASASSALMTSLTQLAFQRVIKEESVAAVMDMAAYQCLVASVVLVIGIFASGDWKKLRGEMMGYKSGPTSYVMNLFWTAVSWQVFTVGCVGIIFRVSSLFSNVISILEMPMAPVMAVVFLGEKMTGWKGVSMVLAMWGSASYVYQHYVDDSEEVKKKEEEGCDHGDEQVCEIGPVAAAERG